MVYQLFQVKQLTFGCNIFECEIATWAKKNFLLKTNMTHQLINDVVSKRFLKQIQEEMIF